ncbi:MAG TPA: glycosyltransferase family 4 protein [Candidatus Acidoferrales bacterium]|nr:glycosyltransferase family 4 protein [Candidatus Acidoferrales bacterium]
MHVCHVWERFWPIDIGGLERYILWLTNYLSKKENIDFSLITGRTKILLVTKNIKKYEDTGFLQVHRLGPTPADIINGACMSIFGHTPKFVDKMRFASLYQEAVNLEMAQTADIFHIHGIWRDLEYINLGIYLSRHYQKPLVVTLHGGYVGDPMQGGMPLKSPPIRSILENDASAITTYSKEVLGTLEQMGLGYKSHLVTNFVDASHFKNPDTTCEHPVTLIYVGRLEPVQTPDLVVDAFKKVNEKFPNTKLTIVGYGRMFEPLKQQIKQLNLENAVTMTGKQTDVRKFLWQSDIFVATNFGYIATLEGWAAGLAVVAPNFGVLKETVTDNFNGLIFEPNSIEDLAAKLTHAIEDTTFRRQIAANGNQTVQSYDIRAVAPKMSAIYHSLLKK